MPAIVFCRVCGETHYADEQCRNVAEPTETVFSVEYFDVEEFNYAS